MHFLAQLLLPGLLWLPISNSLAMPLQSRVPGGIATLKLERNDKMPHFTFRDKTVLITRENDDYLAIVGLPLSLQPGRHFIEGTWGEETAQQKNFFTVRAKKYTTQHITIQDKRKVNPYAKDLKRILREKKRKQVARAVYNSQPADLNFELPVQGIITGSFGKRRIFNGQARRPHSGMDIAAALGTAVKAPSTGTVIEVGDFFFSGNILYLHHGQGLITLFAHLSQIDVELGENVKKGQIIGRVGTTGRVTGPHLHWSVGLNGNWVDPALFLERQ